jgi:aspartyl-tRNA(Asn)/glutamyl-tRNA(Gln) amidotransferase subunit B
MEQAIEFEAKRQIEILEDGGKIVQETRLYDPKRNETRSMRTKEDAHDYRYFPDPDLLPLVISEKMIDDIKKAMPALPDQKRKQFEQLGIPASTAALVTASRGIADYFETTANSVVELSNFSAPKLAEVLTSTANVTVSSSVFASSNWGTALSAPPISPRDFALIQVRWGDGTLSGRMAKEVIDAVAAGEGSPDEIIQKRGLKQISDSGEIEKAVDEVLAANAKQVADYKAGKEKAFNSLVGQVMKATKGKANPAQVNEILRRKLGG